MEKKRIYIQTYGCQMNVHDSEKIMALMEKSGYEPSEDARIADLIIINTCSIREKAAQKVYSQLGRFKQLKRKNQNLILGVGGCLAQQWGSRFIERIPFLDLVFGTHTIHMLPELVEKVKKSGKPVVRIEFQESVKSLNISVPNSNGRISAYITIMQGCNNFCSYCIVPYVRGKEESRPFQDIIDEARILARSGIKEITLLGQNVNSYGLGNGGGYDFADLLQEIELIDGIERIRFTTSHPKDISDKLIGCFSRTGKLCEHIHLPVQAGSDRILAMMNRCYTVNDYCEKVEKLKSVCPSISITSDIIVGFPGETDSDFQATIDMMKKIRFDSIFSFNYSKRTGTDAATLGDTVSALVKRERLMTVQSLQEEHTLEKHKMLEGKTVEILVEGPSKNSGEDVTGRTRTNKIVNFRGNHELIGKVVRVKITDAYLHSLRGDLIEEEVTRC